METSKSIRTSLSARLLIDGMMETRGRIVRMAAGGLLVEGIKNASENARTVIYLETGERFEGTAKQVTDDVISISVKPSPRRHGNLKLYIEKLTGAPTVPVDPRDAPIAERAERVKVDAPTTTCFLSDGRVVPARVTDISLTGMAIAMDHVAEIGDIVRIGKARARIVRRTDNGYGCEIFNGDLSTDLTIPDVADHLSATKSTK